MTALSPYTRRRKLNEAARGGDPGWVDATEVRAHLEHLQSLGWSDSAVARAAGVSSATVFRVRAATYQRCEWRTARALLAAHPTLDATEGKVPAHGTRRRLQALAAIGWPLADTATELGMAGCNVQRLMRYANVAADTHARVAALYRARCMTPGPNAEVRRRAIARGYRPPLAWDDIDHPDESVALGEVGEDRRRDPEPDEAAVVRYLGGDQSIRLTRGDRDAVLDHALDYGWGPQQLSMRTGWSWVASDKALERRRTARRQETAA